MRIWYVAHYAVPGSVSPGWRSHYIGQALARAGHEVTVWAARCHHVLARPCGRAPQAESREEGGYDFRTVPAPLYKGNGLGRMRNILAFSLGLAKAFKAARASGRAPDLAIISSPHPFVWPALEKAAGPSLKMVFEERDIWPESLVELAGLSPWHPLVRYTRRIMDRIARRAEGVISLLPGTEDRFRRLGLPAGRWVWLPNGADPEAVTRAADGPGPEPHLSALAAAKASGRLTVLYAGSMGPPNALEECLALGGITGEKRYTLFLMGDGVSRPALERRARDEGLDFVKFLPQVGRAESWRVIAEAETGYFSTKPVKLYEYGLSFNKIFDYFSLNRPILGVTDSPCNPVSLSGGGWTTPTNRPDILHETLNRVAAMTGAERAAAGSRGRAYLLERHDWRKLGPAYAEFCERIAASESRCPDRTCPK